MCEFKTGCLMRKKYFSYVTFQDINGDKQETKTFPTYKIIYVYTDRIVFYTSTQGVSPSIEKEKTVSKMTDESNIERVIYFTDIILDCGSSQNQLCYAGNYPQILKLKTYKLIQKYIPQSADIKCFTVPFFESSYKLKHEKVAFLCINDLRGLESLIKFKNRLSRTIDKYQMKLGGDRFNSYNGLLRKQRPFIYLKNLITPIPVIARLFGKKIVLVKNDKSASYVEEFSLYQLSQSKIYQVDKAIKKGIVKNDWNINLEVKPSGDCCLVFPGGIIHLN